MSHRTERLATVAFGIATVLFAAVAVASWRSFERADETAAWVEHTHEVMLAIEHVVASVREGETGQRGYLLTGDEEFLQPYLNAMPRIDDELDRLEAMTRYNRSQQERLDRLRELVGEKRLFMARTIALHRDGDRAASGRLVASGRGRQLTERIRALTDEMSAEEERLLGDRAERHQAARARTTALLLLADSVAFAAVAFAALVLMREVTRRRRRSDEARLGALRRQLDDRGLFEARRLERALESLPLATLLVESSQLLVESSQPIVESSPLHVSFANRGARELFGDDLVSRRDVEVAAALSLIDESGRPLTLDALPAWRDVLAGERVNGADVLRAVDGKRCPLRMYAAPLADQDGAVHAAVVSFEDPSASDAAAAEREAAVRFGELFTSLVGHDIRNPLTVLSAGTDALLRRRLPESEARIVERMRVAVERASRMVDQMIDLVHARLGGGVPLHEEPADLGRIARDVIDWIEVQQPERSVVLLAEGDLEGCWDGARVGQVVSDLIHNALRHGGPANRVEVHAHAEDGHVMLDVLGGEQVPRDVRPLLFDPFRRAEGRVRLRSTGLGMGLYLSSQIAEAHGGSLRLVDDNARGGPTRFRLELPRGRVP